MDSNELTDNSRSFLPSRFEWKVPSEGLLLLTGRVRAAVEVDVELIEAEARRCNAALVLKAAPSSWSLPHLRSFYAVEGGLRDVVPVAGTLDEFLALSSPRAIMRFANRHGFLGAYKVLPKLEVLMDGTWQVRHGEPVGMWMHHVARLKTWLHLLELADNAYQGSVRKRRSAEATVMNLFTANENDEARRWYDPVEEGGIEGADHPIFQGMAEDPLEWAAKFVTECARKSLLGRVFLVPALPGSEEVVLPDSLLAWLYLEFFRSIVAMRPGVAERHIACTVCDRTVLENKHARGRKLFCGDACRKLCVRHGLEEARRRKQFTTIPYNDELQATVGRLVSSCGLKRATKMINRLLQQPARNSR